MISLILNICKPGIYKLQHTKKNLVLIKQSSNISKSLLGVINEAAEGFLSPKDLRQDILKGLVTFEVLETISDRPTRELRYNYWVDYYHKTLKYKFYIHPSLNNKRLTYVVHKELSIGTNLEDGFNYFVTVLLRTKKSNPIVVGLFSSMNDADVFISESYPLPLISSIIYANNELTRNYFKEEASKLKKDIKLSKT